MKLLIVTANKVEIVKHLQQLKIMGFEVDVATDLEMAVKCIQMRKYGVVLLSWGLPDQDLPAAYKAISEAHGLPCLIFSEDRSRKATNLLLTSGIRNVLYPPLSAHGIHRRIQLLLRAQGGQGPKKLRTVRPEVAPAEARRERKKNLDDSFKGALKALVGEGAAGNFSSTEKNLVVLTEIQWPESQGYLLVASDRPVQEKDFLPRVQGRVMDFLESNGQAQGAAGKCHKVEVDFKTLRKWISTRAECYLEENFGQVEVLMAFADTDALPAMSPAASPEFTWVDVNRWLTTKGKLPFDVYVHLPENQKHVLYIRKDTVISEQNLARLSKIGSDRCFIKPDDCANLFRYLFLNPDFIPSV